MRDVRRHGQDVTLTLTVDPHVSDEQLSLSQMTLDLSAVEISNFLISASLVE